MDLRNFLNLLENVLKIGFFQIECIWKQMYINNYILTPSDSFDHPKGAYIPLRVSSEPFDPSVGFYKPLASTSYVIDSHKCLLAS